MYYYTIVLIYGEEGINREKNVGRVWMKKGKNECKNQ